MSLYAEQLEVRYCPVAPVITLAATPLTGQTVQLTGTVTDEDPALVVISFSGVMTGSTSPDTAGAYSFTADAAGLGTVQAVGVDIEQLASNVAAADVTSAAPTLTLSIAYGSQRTVILSGQVTDESPGGLTVSFSGVAAGSVFTNADGSYSATLEASALGTIQASTQDVWGQPSNTAQVTVSSNAPSVLNFVAIHEIGNYWTFQGQVTDESAEGLTVTFGGQLPSLTGLTATVGADGWFFLTIELQPGEGGTATAQTTDWWGLNSNIAMYVVNPI